MKKKCAFCAQELPADATVCMFCTRKQPGQRFGGVARSVGYMSMGRLAVLVAVGTVALMAWVTNWQPTKFQQLSNKPVEQKPLRVSGSRYSRGIEIINREAEPLAGCVLSIPNQARSSEWSAPVQKLAPNEPRTVTWAEFRGTDGTGIPVYVGETTRYAVIRCDSPKETRKGTVLVFR